MQETHIYVGVNGSGKSFKLGEIAKAALKSRAPVAAVSMSLNDKFPRNTKRRPYSFMGIKQGRSVYTQAIEHAIAGCNRNESPVQINTLLNILKYAGYKEKIGFKVQKFDWDFERIFDSSSVLESTPKKTMEKIYSLCLAYRRIHNEDDDENIHWITSYSKFGSQSVLDSEFRYGEVFTGEVLSELLNYKSYLRKLKTIKNIKVFFEKQDNDKLFSISDMSSGELTLISTAFFLSLSLEEGAVLLIDEPENSLHPEWQLSYLSRLKDLFPYTSFQCHIATHSPLIISGAQKEEGTYIYRFNGRDFEKIRADSKNIEDALIDQFGIITPKNNALSERCIDLLNSVIDGLTSKDDAIRQIENYKSSSYEGAQLEFLDGVLVILRDEI